MALNRSRMRRKGGKNERMGVGLFGEIDVLDEIDMVRIVGIV